LDAGGERALQRHFDKGVRIRADAAGGFAFGLLIDGGDVQDIGIVLDEILQQPRKLRGVRGVVHIQDPAGQRQRLPLAQELFAQVLLELQRFVGERAGDLVLLHALGILKLLFA